MRFAKLNQWLNASLAAGKGGQAAADRIKSPGGENLSRMVLIDDERCVLEEPGFLLAGKAEIAAKFRNPITAVENNS